MNNPWFRKWLKRRIPRQSEYRLQHRNIFILPSKTGLGFIVLVILLWLLGTNYQNNLVLSVAFLLLALIVVCIHHTYANLSGLIIRVVKTHPGFVDDEGVVDLYIHAESKRDYEAIEMAWSKDHSMSISLLKEKQIRISLRVPLLKRGWYQPERLRIATQFPLGLIVAWSYLDLEAPILAYPKPIQNNIKPIPQVLDDSDDTEHSLLIAGHEEFAGLREYQPGDSLRSIDWRAMARGQGLASRIYEDYVSQYEWLDWQQFDGLDREARLSRLCDCVLMQAETLTVYGLRLPNLTIKPAQGEEHKKQELEALAVIEWNYND